MIELTKLEADAIDLSLNYAEYENQLSDNFSNAGMDELTSQFGSKHVAAGVIGSLTKKGLIYYDDESDLFFLEEEPLKEVFETLKAMGYDVEV